MTNYDVIVKFKNGVDKRYSGKTVFAVNGSLYSWGTHFTLAIRRDEESNKKDGKKWVLLNGDRNSRTTNRHEEMTFRVFLDMPRVAFSAIEAAGIEPHLCNVVDWDGDRQERCYEGDEGFETFREHVPLGATYSEHETTLRYIEETYTTLDNPVKVRSYHRVGGVVLEQGGKHYLCAMDENSYFVSLLPRPVVSVNDGFKALMPERVQDALVDNVDVTRQGEWFFIPRVSVESCLPDVALFPDMPPTMIREKDWSPRMATLPKKDPRSSNHIVTKMLSKCNMIFVKGNVRHKRNGGGNGDHRFLKLEKGVVYEAVRNTSVGDWSAQGRVD